jgi:hypothetical protein
MARHAAETEPVEADAQQPIFVVGASRSGTTLMAACLNAGSALLIADETHYFDDLRPRLRAPSRPLREPEERRVCEDYFLALAHRLYGQGGDPEQSPIPREVLRARAEQLGGSADDHFEAFCRLQAEALGRARWGEKTPRHLFRAAEILERYPAACFVCMMRDPRAVVASYRSFKQGPGASAAVDVRHREALEREQQRVGASYHVVLASLVWRSVAGATSALSGRYGPERVRVVRYEDLVAGPEAVLRDLCDWLAVPYRPEMISTVPLTASSFEAFRPDSGLVTASLERWREELSEGEVRAVELCAGSALERWGYGRVGRSLPPFSALRPWLTLPAGMLRAFWANRARLGNVLGYLWRRGRAILT